MNATRKSIDSNILHGSPKNMQSLIMPALHIPRYTYPCCVCRTWGTHVHMNCAAHAFLLWPMRTLPHRYVHAGLMHRTAYILYRCLFTGEVQFT